MIDNADRRLSAQIQMVLFNIGPNEYGLEVDLVQEVIRPPQITRAPRVPRFIKGVINLRGSIVPVLDVGELLGHRSEEIRIYKRVIIAHQHDITLGLLVEGVKEVAYIDVSSEIPASAEQKESLYLKGIGKLGERLVLLIDLAGLLEGVQTAK